MTDLALLSAEDLLALFARGAASPVEALQAVTERIARLNPSINAFAAMNPASLAQAGESAARWRAGRPIGPLDGVPVTEFCMLRKVSPRERLALFCDVCRAVCRVRARAR